MGLAGPVTYKVIFHSCREVTRKQAKVRHRSPELLVFDADRKKQPSYGFSLVAALFKGSGLVVF